MVFLKLKQHYQHLLMNKISPKLSARYYGPFEILEKIGVVAYCLKLPPSSRIHPVVHVSLLKEVVGYYKIVDKLPTWVEDENVEVM